MLLILIKKKKKNLNFLIVILAYVQGAQRKKQLTTCFVEHFKENEENTICIYFAMVIKMVI